MQITETNTIMHPTILIKMYEYAVKLIKKGKAYVCDLTPEEIREYRGTLTEPGKKQSLPGTYCRRKSGFIHSNEEWGSFRTEARFFVRRLICHPEIINMRDPIIYRIARMYHHNTGDKWW